MKKTEEVQGAQPQLNPETFDPARPGIGKSTDHVLSTEPEGSLESYTLHELEFRASVSMPQRQGFILS